MADEEEKLDVEGAVKCLNEALRLQYAAAWAAHSPDSQLPERWRSALRRAVIGDGRR